MNVKRKLAIEGEIYQQQFLRDLTPESAIVEAWVDQIKLVGRGNTGSSVLTYGSENSDFENLVRTTISTRGITTHSIIQRLLATKSIEQDKSKKLLKLMVEQFSPYLSNDEPNIVNAAFSAISNLISTIEYNIKSPNDQKVFQRQTWTFRLKPSDQLKFRDTMRQFLQDADKQARQKIRPWEMDEYSASALVFVAPWRKQDPVLSSVSTMATMHRTSLRTFTSSPKQHRAIFTYVCPMAAKLSPPASGRTLQRIWRFLPFPHLNWSVRVLATVTRSKSAISFWPSAVRLA